MDNPKIIITLDEMRQTIKFDLENCDHRQAQSILISVLAENQKLMTEEGEHDHVQPHGD